MDGCQGTLTCLDCTARWSGGHLQRRLQRPVLGVSLATRLGVGQRRVEHLEAERISSSVLVSGGAMRKTPPIPGSWTMFMCRPSSRQCRVTAAPSWSALASSRGPGRARRPAAARGRGRRRPPRGGPAAPAGRAAGARRASGPAGRARRVRARQHGVADRGRQRVRHVRGEEEEAALVRLLLDLGAGDHRRQRQPGAERLGQREDVRARRRRARTRTRCRCGTARSAPRRGSAASRARAHLALQRGEVAGRRVDDAARAQDRLDDAGREAADGLRVDQRRTPKSSWRRQSSSPSAMVKSGR